MDNQIRPSNLGEILDRTAQLYRRNFWLFVGTATLPLLLILVLAIPVGAIFAIPGITGGALDSVLPGIVIALVCLVAIPGYLAAYVFSYAGITQAAVSVYNGQKPTFRATLASVRPRFWTYLWYLILQGFFAAFVPMAIAFALAAPLIYLIARSDLDFSSRLAIGFVLALVVVAALGAVIWMTLSYAMGMAVCIAERKTAWESIVRTLHLSPGARGRIFVTYLLVIALAIGVGMALAIPLLILITVLPTLSNSALGSPSAFLVMQIVRVFMDFASQVLLAPVFMIATVLFYYDQRIRKEGYDIEWMMQQAGLAAPQPQVPPAGILGLAEPPSQAPAAGTAEFPPSTPSDTV